MFVICMAAVEIFDNFSLLGGLLAAPKTAEVLDLLHSSLNSDAVDDFWIGLDDV